ncbi:MAG: hypothetical protein RBS07_15845 [Lentimicrobium sp.]|jgi:phage gpG-like protein|nr:hypothetical protein [Lentimicrobium sp.]
MTPKEFEILLQKRAQEIAVYASSRWPAEAGNTALRFINGNFRAQGYQGRSFQPWKKGKKKRGTTLVNKGHLRSASYYVTGVGVVTMRNTRPYAAIHNEGGYINATQSVNQYTRKAHTRRFKGKRIKVKATIISAHMRKINTKIDARPFFPTTNNPSPVLNNAVERKILAEFKRIFYNN